MAKDVPNNAYVYLVGAGPGDPKLITLKGIECIQKADVIVYDRLANKRLLSYARPDVELIYAGKSPDNHVLRQEDINRVLIEKALENKVVTRLKGGDPFIFGRGGEEAEELIEVGIPFEIVPGISSAVSAPAYAGIPVTHRDFATSVAFLTGNEDPSKPHSRINWEKIATGADTLVFLMGMKNLPLIVENLIKFGRDPKTPTAIIRLATRPEQETVIGPLDEIESLANAKKLKNPAVIVVGDVVQLREKLQWFENKPLFGKRVVVTRSRTQASALSEIIHNLGGEAFEFPAIETVPPEDLGPLDNALENIKSYDWVVMTSANGVSGFFSRLAELKIDIRELSGIKFAAVGPATKKAIESYGLRVDLVPQEYVAEGVLEALKNEGVEGKKFLLPRANLAREELATKLSQMGAIVDDVITYLTVPGSGDIDALMEYLKDGLVDIITFTSSSTVKNFISKLGKENIEGLLDNVMIASIGPITSKTCRELGLKVDVEPTEYTIPSLVEAIKEALNITEETN